MFKGQKSLPPWGTWTLVKSPQIDNDFVFYWVCSYLFAFFNFLSCYNQFLHSPISYISFKTHRVIKECCCCSCCCQWANQSREVAWSSGLGCWIWNLEVPGSNPLPYRCLNEPVAWWVIQSASWSENLLVKMKAHAHLSLSGTPPPRIMTTGFGALVPTLFSRSSPQQASYIRSNLLHENI